MNLSFSTFVKPHVDELVTAQDFSIHTWTTDFDIITFILIVYHAYHIYSRNSSRF